MSFLLTVVALFCVTFHSLPANAGEDVFSKKVKTLCAEKKTRVEKIKAIHAFVKDNVKQIKTSYG